MRLPIIVTRRGGITLGAGNEQVTYRPDHPQFASIVATLKNPPPQGGPTVDIDQSSGPALSARQETGFQVVAFTASGRESILAREMATGRGAKRFAVLLEAEDGLEALGEKLKRVEVRDVQAPSSPCFAMEWH